MKQVAKHPCMQKGVTLVDLTFTVCGVRPPLVQVSVIICGFHSRETSHPARDMHMICLQNIYCATARHRDLK